MILDEQDSVIAGSTQPVAQEAALLRVLAEARAGRRAVCAGHLWAAPASAGSEYLGTLVLRSGPDLPETDRLILERAAMVTALLLLLRRSVAEAEQQVRGDLLTDLLTTPHRDPESLRDRALRLGADLNKPHVVVVVRAEPALQARLRPAAAHLAATNHGFAASFEGHTVLLLPGDEPPAILSDIAAAMEAEGWPASDSCRRRDVRTRAGRGHRRIRLPAGLPMCRGASRARPTRYRRHARTLDSSACCCQTARTCRASSCRDRGSIDYDARKGTELVRNG